MEENTSRPEETGNRLPEIYTLIWKANETDDTFNPTEFKSRIPRLMVWLKDLYKQGKLVGCGGGGYENHAGGLTLIKAESPEEAMQLAAGSPMNEIGKTEILVWDVYFGALDVRQQESVLAG